MLNKSLSGDKKSGRILHCITASEYKKYTEKCMESGLYHRVQKMMFRPTYKLLGLNLAMALTEPGENAQVPEMEILIGFQLHRYSSTIWERLVLTRPSSRRKKSARARVQIQSAREIGSGFAL